jgi:hypothetical protein
MNGAKVNRKLPLLAANFKNDDEDDFYEVCT